MTSLCDDLYHVILQNNDSIKIVADSQLNICVIQTFDVQLF